MSVTRWLFSLSPDVQTTLPVLCYSQIRHTIVSLSLMHLPHGSTRQPVSQLWPKQQGKDVGGPRSVKSVRADGNLLHCRRKCCCSWKKHWALRSWSAPTSLTKAGRSCAGDRPVTTAGHPGTRASSELRAQLSSTAQSSIRRSSTEEPLLIQLSLQATSNNATLRSPTRITP